MSSILKALKKAEDESSRREVPSAGASGRRSAADIIEKNEGSRARIQRIIGGVLTVIIISGVAWGVYLRPSPVSETERLSSSPSITVAEKEQEAVAAGGKPLASAQGEKADSGKGKLPPATDSVQAKPVQKKPPAVKPDEVKGLHEIFQNAAKKSKSRVSENPQAKNPFGAFLPKPAPENSDSSKTALKPKKSAGSSAGKASPLSPSGSEPSRVRKPKPKAQKTKKPPVGKADPSSEKAAAPQPAKPSAPRMEKTSAADRHPGVRLKTSGETGIEIQALVWSEDSRQRMAVINGSVVRQQETVEDVSITHIGTDYIIFRKANEEWKQQFRIN